MAAETVDRPKRLPLIAIPSNRDESTAKDARLVNAYVEKDPLTGEYQVYKRPGQLAYSQPSGGAATGRGIYNWKGDIYSIFGTTLYKATTSKGTVNATNGVYRFDSCLGTTHKLVLGDGVKGYTYDDSGGLVNITDAQFPAAFVKGWGYLDGTTYVGLTTAYIQGSDINDPQAWDALNSILAQIEPDAGVALSKQLVYIVSFKQWTTEIFYDAGNATGSPLGSVQGAKVNYGCISQDSVQDLDGTLFWLSATKAGAVQVVKLENLKAEVVSSPAVERLLAAADFTSVYSFTLKYEGHRWYVFTLTVTNITLAYDASTGLWAQWTDTNGDYLPIVSSTFDATRSRTLLQHASNGRIYYVDAAQTTDGDDLFSVEIYTPNFDAGVDRRKQLNVMRFLGDQVTGSVLQVRYNDDDYALTKWTNFRNVQLEQKRPVLTNNGAFYRRAYHLRHRCATRLRLQAIELQYDIGTL